MSKFLKTSFSGTIHGTEKKETFTVSDIINGATIEENNNKATISGKVFLLDTIEVSEEAAEETTEEVSEEAAEEN